MTLKRPVACLMPLIGVLLSACATTFSTATDTATGQHHIYAMTTEQALALAHSAISESFPDSVVTPLDAPDLGYSAHTRAAFDTSAQQVLVVPVTGVTAAGATVDGYTFEVSGRGTIGAGDINTASFFAHLQQDLDKTGDVVDVVRSEPHSTTTSAG
jgi:hypothetical protein